MKAAEFNQSCETQRITNDQARKQIVAFYKKVINLLEVGKAKKHLRVIDSGTSNYDFRFQPWRRYDMTISFDTWSTRSLHIIAGLATVKGCIQPRVFCVFEYIEFHDADQSRKSTKKLLVGCFDDFDSEKIRFTVRDTEGKETTIGTCELTEEILFSLLYACQYDSTSELDECIERIKKELNNAD